MKLALYSFIGSAMVLVVLIASYVVSGATSFDLNQLAQFREQLGGFSVFHLRRLNTHEEGALQLSWFVGEKIGHRENTQAIATAVGVK